MNPQPIKITKYLQLGIEVAIFNYLDGLKYTTNHNLTNAFTIADLLTDDTKYKILCGEIHVIVLPTDYPLIKRQINRLIKY